MRDGATRDGYGAALVELGSSHPDVVVLDSGVSDSTRTKKFGQEFPDRFFNMGISEADMVCTAAGLAMTGKTAFATSFACFLLGRTMDQILVSVAYSNANVKLVGTHSGLAVGEDGPSAQMIVDLAYTRAMPNMTVIQPADWEEAVQATKALAEHKGPVYLRLGRPKLKGIYDSSYKFEIGKANVIRSGTDIVVFATGALVQESLQAAETLANEKISVTVVNVSTLKPLDATLIVNEARKHGAVVTAEDHNIIGGLSDAVRHALTDQDVAVPIKSVAVRDHFAETGTGAELYEKYGLSANHVVARIKETLAKKKS
ncbi:MAG: transketolase family protein [Nitrospinae bacterium]|nr:transketolase family protein [Nitrospinota bacterium]